MENSLETPQDILNYQPKTYRNHWIFWHLLFLIIIFFLFLFYPIETRLEYVGYYQEGTIHLTVSEDFFELETHELEIQGTKYRYEIKKVEPVLYEDGAANFWNITISIPLRDDWKIDNYTFHLSFLKERKTLFIRIKNKIKKGMRL